MLFLPHFAVLLRLVHPGDEGPGTAVPGAPGAGAGLGLGSGSGSGSGSRSGSCPLPGQGERETGPAHVTRHGVGAARPCPALIGCSAAGGGIMGGASPAPYSLIGSTVPPCAHRAPDWPPPQRVRGGARRALSLACRVVGGAQAAGSQSALRSPRRPRPRALIRGAGGAGGSERRAGGPWWGWVLRSPGPLPPLPPRGCSRSAPPSPSSCSNAAEMRPGQIARLKQQLQRTKLSGRSGKEKEKSCPFPGDHTLLGSLQDSPSAFPCPSPALRLSPCLHRSLEGLNQELEEVFVREQGDEELLRVLDVPDGHRAPAPAQPDSMDASLALEPGSTLWSSLSPSLQSPGRPSEAQPEPREKDRSSPSPVPAFAASPRPNHSFVFKREPPEGCERVRAFEEAPPPIPPEPFQCPDKNKVHFSPSGSAFCPVRLARPLFPAMEFPGVGFLLRSFPAAPGAFLERLPETPARNCEPWKHGQPEESSHAVFQSSLVA
ncbi:protein FAM117A isoform X1 [Pithys albifrons albifrons]|uniref:protein FAM117A isoform X1 n=1 Tax=Pithys albifrons albifrons TaxID=3385563 RepID=UPI003A5CA8CE